MNELNINALLDTIVQNLSTLNINTIKFHGNFNVLFEKAYPLPTIFITIANQSLKRGYDNSNGIFIIKTINIDIYVQNKDITNQDLSIYEVLSNIESKLNYLAIEGKYLIWKDNGLIMFHEDGRYIYRTSFYINDITFITKKC